MNWKYKINIKRWIQKGSGLCDGDDVPREILSGIVEELGKVPGLLNHFVFSLTNGDVQTVGELNAWLDHLYDYCDEHAIWLGLFEPTQEAQP